MPIDQFNSVFNSVCRPRPVNALLEYGLGFLRHQVVRFLDSLGHCEFDFDTRMVYACPPVFAVLPSYGLPKAVLTGARTSNLIKNLKQAVKKKSRQAALSITAQDTAGLDFPALISVEAVSFRVLEEIASAVGINCEAKEPAAWRLANFSAGLEELKGSLKFGEREELNWAQKVFNPDTLSFSLRRSGLPEGYKLASYKNPVSQQLRHWLWDGENAADVNRDWGRYFVLEALKLSVLLFDERYQNLAVPLNVPLPCLLARAVTLCSGQVPHISKTGTKRAGDIPPEYDISIYSGVTPPVANLVARKLGQALVPYSLEPIKKGVLDD